MRSVAALKSSNVNYLAQTITAVITILIATKWWPDVIPFEALGAPFWDIRGNPGSWILAVWPIFVWAIAVNVFYGWVRMGDALARYLRFLEPSGVEVLGWGTLISLIASIREEIMFRWLFYLAGIAGVVFSNWLFGTVFLYILLGLLALGLTIWVANSFKAPLFAILTGAFSPLGVVMFIRSGGCLDPIQWFYGVIFVPIADWTSFGLMHSVLYQEHSWAVGAAVVSANILFRDGHKYQGWFGMVNAWYIGLVFFWLMFNYGLLAAIFCHFLYDFCVYATAAAMQGLRLRAR